MENLLSREAEGGIFNELAFTCPPPSGFFLGQPLDYWHMLYLQILSLSGI